MKAGIRHQFGITYVELLAAVTIAALLTIGLMGVVSEALQSRDIVSEQNDLNRQARFALQRMVRSVSHSRLLLLPHNDKPWSNWRENIREETVPPTVPTDDSSKYTAVLAVTLPHYVDHDNDSFPDADNDRDGRIDEDLPNDWNYDSAPGIYLIDDDGDGIVDENISGDSDDESSTLNDDPIDGLDNDGDDNIDEDPPSDMNNDGCPGICGVDDDGDGQVDEGSADDDDEDGGQWEDWYDPLVFFLDGNTLKERMPVPWDEDSSGSVNGRDFITSDIADNVTRFRVERLRQLGNQPVLVEIILELASPLSGESVSLRTRVRVGAAL